MTPAEHHAEADRLLKLADGTPVIRLTGDEPTAEQAQRVRDQYEEATGSKPLIVAGRIHINDTALVLAALTHAVLSLEDPHPW